MSDTEKPEWVDDETEDETLPDPVVVTEEEVPEVDVFGTEPVPADPKIEGTVGLV